MTAPGHSLCPQPPPPLSGFDVVWTSGSPMGRNSPTPKKGLVLDGESGGWFFDVASDEGSVMCIVSNLDGDGTRISLSVTEIGGAADGVDRAVEALLNSSSEIVDLEVDR